MAYATVADVEARLGRDLDASESQIVTVRLNDVELLIKSRLPNLDELIADDELDVDLVKMIEADVVLRLIKNPDGFRSETDGNYSYQIDERVASGRLDIMAREWTLLGVKSGAYTVRPYLLPYGPLSYYPWEDATLPFDQFPPWDGELGPDWTEFRT